MSKQTSSHLQHRLLRREKLAWQRLVGLQIEHRHLRDAAGGDAFDEVPVDFVACGVFAKQMMVLRMRLAGDRAHCADLVGSALHAFEHDARFARFRFVDVKQVD